VKTPFQDEGDGHSPILGFAFDGFPLHGPYEQPGVVARDLSGARSLDVCNGHTDADRGYHYHVTPDRFPYLIGGYAGVPEPANNPGIRRAGSGAIADNASGTSREGRPIRSVTPGTVTRGKTHTLRLELDPSSVRGSLPAGPPSWVQFGPFEASKIAREGDVVTVELAIGADAQPGVLLDVHAEFERSVGSGQGRVVVVKKNNALRIVDAGIPLGRAGQVIQSGASAPLRSVPVP
jgi:hypothetical protein